MWKRDYFFGSLQCVNSSQRLFCWGYSNISGYRRWIYQVVAHWSEAFVCPFNYSFESSEALVGSLFIFSSLLYSIFLTFTNSKLESDTLKDPEFKMEVMISEIFGFTSFSLTSYSSSKCVCVWVNGRATRLTHLLLIRRLLLRTGSLFGEAVSKWCSTLKCPVRIPMQR